jgi:flagellar biosynthetic protein FliR
MELCPLVNRLTIGHRCLNIRTPERLIMDLTTWLDLASGQLTTGLLIFARFSALLLAMPLLGGKTVPAAVRIGFCGALALVLTPLASVAPVTEAPRLIVGLLKEVAVGLVLGWTASLFFAAVQMAGEWLDLQAGFQASQLLNPALETHAGPLGSFSNLLAGIVFLGTGAHTIVIRAAARSLAVSPPGALRLHVGEAGDWTALVAQVVWLAVQLAAPVAAALFLAEIAVGLINRALPQVNVMMLTLPVKSALAIGVLAVSIPVLARALERLFAQMGAQVLGIARVLGGS